MKNYFDLSGQVALVTGCSTGLGVQMAKALANQGAKIVALARRKEMVDAVAAEITKEFGVEAIGISCDITDTDRVDAAVDEILAKFGRIDILINNAGTGAIAPAEDITDAQFNGELNVDLGGTFKVSRAVAKKAMLPAKYGRIINIASMYGLVGNKVAGCAPYHAAKGGVVNLTRALASEWSSKGINVNIKEWKGALGSVWAVLDDTMQSNLIVSITGNTMTLGGDSTFILSNFPSKLTKK